MIPFFVFLHSDFPPALFFESFPSNTTLVTIILYHVSPQSHFLVDQLCHSFLMLLLLPQSLYLCLSHGASLLFGHIFFKEYLANFLIIFSHCFYFINIFEKDSIIRPFSQHRFYLAHLLRLKQPWANKPKYIVLKHKPNVNLSLRNCVFQETW